MVVIVTESNCQLSQDVCGGGGVAWRRVCAAQVAPLQHCSTAAGQTWPGLGRVEFHHCTVWTLPDTGQWTHTTPPLSSAVSQNQITEIFQISSCSCAVHCRPCSCRAPVINTGVERSLTRPHHDNTGADSRSRGHISRGSSPRVKHE